MKTLSYLLPLFIFCLLATSCHKNNDQLIGIEEMDAPPHVVSRAIAIDGVNPVVALNTHDSQIFENRLQWVSFITGKILRYNEDARTEVLNLLPPGKYIIRLNTLLPDNGVIGTAFEADFLHYLQIYMTPGHPHHEIDIPPLGAPIGTPIPEVVQEFLDDVLENNCVELYFPNRLELSLAVNYTITSTAHPLNDSLSNDGIVRFFVPRNIGGIIKETNRVRVTPGYVSRNPNIIVARPYREVNECSYDNYASLDFTDFLRN